MKIDISLPSSHNDIQSSAVNLIDAAKVFANGRLNFEVDTKHIVAFAMMKSASSFVVNSLSRILSYQLKEYSKKFTPQEYWLHTGTQEDLSLCGYFNGNHTPELMRMFLAALESNTVSQQHAIADAPTLWALKSFPNFQPIILQRNIPDAILSMHDDIMKEQDRPVRAWGTDKIMWGTHIFHYQSPKVWERFFNLPFEERIDDLITFAVPWYYSFIVSWRKAAELGIIDGLFLRYEDLPGGEENFLRRIIQFAGLEASDEEIEAGISAARGDKDRSRLNKGINGRGKKLLSTEQMDRICRMGQFVCEDEVIQEYVLEDYS